jgi:hypothetical protein
MLKHAMFVLVLASVGCIPPSYVVTNVHGDVQTKCVVDDRGHVTDVCHDESTDGDDGVVYGNAPQVADPNPNDEVAPGGLERLAPHAAPAASDVARALAAPPVRALLDRCRDGSQPELDRLTVQLTVAPSGEVSKIAPLGVSDPLGACAAQAIHTAQLPAFHGNAVAFQQDVAL